MIVLWPATVRLGAQAAASQAESAAGQAQEKSLAAPVPESVPKVTPQPPISTAAIAGYEGKVVQSILLPGVPERDRDHQIGRAHV